MRTLLREALKKALEKTYGQPFDFGTGFLDQINESEIKLPCVWVCPFDLVGKTKRNEGTKTYLGTFYMLESALKDVQGKQEPVLLSPEEKDARWDYMETAAVNALADIVGADGIIEIAQYKGLPNEGAYTGFNDLSMKITFEVTIQYCRERC